MVKDLIILYGEMLEAGTLNGIFLIFYFHEKQHGKERTFEV